MKEAEEIMKRKKKLFIEELEVRQSSSPLFISPIERIPIDRFFPTLIGSEGGEFYPSKPIGEGGVTTQALGEEGGTYPPLVPMDEVGGKGGHHVTTFAIGEEGGSSLTK